MRRALAFRWVSAKVASCALGVAFGLSSIGCDDPLTRVDLVANLRVLGARIEVAGEPDRASPAPGENARVRWLVADRDPEPLLGWAFAICAAAPPGGSLPTCGAEPFASAAADVPVIGEPSIDFVVPGDIEAEALAVFGVVCRDSEPTFENEAFGCTGPGGRLVSLDFELETAERSNRNPVIRPDAFTFDGANLPEGLDCGTLPSVTRGSSHTFELRLDESDRDTVPQSSSTEPPKEELQVSHFTTAGELERAFTVFEAGDENLVTRVSWKAPKSAPADRIVRFFFVVRDLRGGSDFMERAICIEP